MSDDLTRLTDEEREALWQSGEVSSINTEPDSNLVAAVESILAARTAALIDRLAVSDAETAARQAEVERLLVRAERAEREYAEAAFAVTQLAALRAAVTGLAEQWENYDAEGYAAGDGPDWWTRTDQLRALLTDEGDNQ